MGIINCKKIKKKIKLSKFHIYIYINIVVSFFWVPYIGYKIRTWAKEMGQSEVLLGHIGEPIGNLMIKHCEQQQQKIK
jgi:hypothetical protein